MLDNVKRISIIGGPGTGKSTLANNLGRELELAIYHLDAICYFENWKKRDKQERDKIILEKINESKWVIDGTYKTTIEERIKKSDMVIFLEFSTIARLKGIFLRYFKLRGKEKPEIPGCKERMNWKFVEFAIDWNKINCNIINEVLEKNKDKKIFIFHNRKQLNKWYEKEFNKKIEI